MNLRAELDAPRALRDYGLRESDLAAATQAVLAVVPLDNPAAVNEDNIIGLLHAAWGRADPQ